MGISGAGVLFSILEVTSWLHNEVNATKEPKRASWYLLLVLLFGESIFSLNFERMCLLEEI